MKIRCRFSYYDPSFSLNEIYDFGVSIAKEIDHNINGGLACEYADVGLLAQASCRNGHHLEFGTLFGATAIAVAMTKKKFGIFGDVYTVDNGQYQDKLVRQQNIPFPENMLLDNFRMFGIEERVHTIKANTNPLPDPVNRMQFASAFIDAGHDFENCYSDFENAKERTNIIVFHDYDDSHPGVVQAVEMATRDPKWWLVHISRHSAIMELKKEDFGVKKWRKIMSGQ